MFQKVYNMDKLILSRNIRPDTSPIYEKKPIQTPDEATYPQEFQSKRYVIYFKFFFIYS